MTDSTRTRSYFPYDKGIVAFNESFVRMLGKNQGEISAKYLPPENTQRFRHGGDWRHPGNNDAVSAKMQTHSAVLKTPFDHLIENDLSILDRSFSQIAETMHRQFAEMLYSTVAEACDQSGNTVDAQAQGSLEEAFMAMIERIQFAVNKDGTVTLPEIHTSPETAERMWAALEGASPEFREQFEILKARKTEEALAREAERKAKFARYGSEPCAS
jgi:hypothetical protein